MEGTTAADARDENGAKPREVLLPPLVSVNSAVPSDEWGPGPVPPSPGAVLGEPLTLRRGSELGPAFGSAGPKLLPRGFTIRVCSAERDAAPPGSTSDYPDQGYGPAAAGACEPGTGILPGAPYSSLWGSGFSVPDSTGNSLLDFEGAGGMGLPPTLDHTESRLPSLSDILSDPELAKGFARSSSEHKEFADAIVGGGSCDSPTSQGGADITRTGEQALRLIERVRELVIKSAREKEWRLNAFRDQRMLDSVALFVKQRLTSIALLRVTGAAGPFARIHRSGTSGVSGAVGRSNSGQLRASGFWGSSDLVASGPVGTGLSSTTAGSASSPDGAGAPEGDGSMFVPSLAGSASGAPLDESGGGGPVQVRRGGSHSSVCGGGPQGPLAPTTAFRGLIQVAQLPVMLKLLRNLLTCAPECPSSAAYLLEQQVLPDLMQNIDAIIEIMQAGGKASGAGEVVAGELKVHASEFFKALLQFGQNMATQLPRSAREAQLRQIVPLQAAKMLAAGTAETGELMACFLSTLAHDVNAPRILELFGTGQHAQLFWWLLTGRCLQSALKRTKVCAAAAGAAGAGEDDSRVSLLRGCGSGALAATTSGASGPCESPPAATASPKNAAAGPKHPLPVSQFYTSLIGSILACERSAHRSSQLLFCLVAQHLETCVPEAFTFAAHGGSGAGGSPRNAPAKPQAAPPSIRPTLQRTWTGGPLLDEDALLAPAADFKAADVEAFFLRAVFHSLDTGDARQLLASGRFWEFVESRMAQTLDLLKQPLSPCDPGTSAPKALHHRRLQRALAVAPALFEFVGAATRSKIPQAFAVEKLLGASADLLVHARDRVCHDTLPKDNLLPKDVLLDLLLIVGNVASHHPAAVKIALPDATVSSEALKAIVGCAHIDPEVPGLEEAAILAIRAICASSEDASRVVRSVINESGAADLWKTRLAGVGTGSTGP